MLRAAALVLSLLFPLTLLADEASHDIQVDDYFSLAALLDVQLSPDGQHAVYVDLRWEVEHKRRNSDLWLVHVESRQTRRLTFEPGSDNHPRFSPDGEWIYFSSRRSGKNQVWRMRISGDGLQQITRGASGIQTFELAHSGETLYYSVPRRHVSEPWRSLRTRFSMVSYGHGTNTYSKIMALDLQSWRSRTVLNRDRVLVAMAIAPDEDRIALITRPTQALITNEGQSTVDIYNAHTGEVTPLTDTLWRAEAPSPYGWLDAPSWSRDGKALAFTVDYDGYPSEILIAGFAPDSAPVIHRLARPGQITVQAGTRPQWRGDSKDLLYAGEDHARIRVYLQEDATEANAPSAQAVTAGDVVVGRFALSHRGDSMAFIMSHPESFGDLYQTRVRKGQGRFTQLTEINPQVQSWKLPQLEIVRWTSRDGREVEGVLAIPHGADRSQPLPTVVYLHGGPASATRYRLRFWGYGRTLMAAQGYATFSPNYRGSTGYGDTFLVDLIGRKNDVDIADILSGVDALVERRIADPERLGVMGWSNGGYLTNCVLTHTDRFKAASSGAGVFDVAMQWAIEDTPGHVINYQRGLPWEQAESMQNASPMYDAQKITTPTVIHVGENDPRVPAEHSRALHRALHEYLHVPTELLVYPGEGHGLSRYDHRRAKMTWDVAWFRKYMVAPTESQVEPPPET